MALIASLTLGPEALDDARVELVKLKGARVVVWFVWVLLLPNGPRSPVR